MPSTFMREVVVSMPVKVSVVYHSGQLHARHGGQSDIDLPCDVAPPSSDLRTAELLGQRVAEFAQVVSAGRSALGRPVTRGVAGGADRQDTVGRGLVTRQDGDTAFNST
jgi:hypothetical protein